MKLVRAFLALGAAALSLAVQAHAFLDHAEPRVGSTVAVAPAEARLWFSEAIEPAFSTVTVVDANGKRVDTGPSQVDPRDPLLLGVPLGRLAPGAYTAIWRAVSIDTHVTEGRFMFHVGP
jgi:copper resistance protein C